MLIVASGAARLHLAAAVSAHCRRLRADGVQPPAELAALAAALSASDGQERPGFDAAVSGVDDQPMTQPLALDYRSAAERLSVSERSIRRLVAEGKLTAVRIGGRTVIRSADLAAFLAGLAPAPHEASR